MSAGAAPRGKVLVIEDEAGINRLLRSHLERAGYRAESAFTTSEAREKIRADRFDLLVLDYQLAERQTGLDFYRALQREGSDVPAILVTGFSDEARLVEALRAGVRDYIIKTPNFIDLVGPTVDRVMLQVRAERQLIEAEAASRAKDDFLATLSHELRTPLTPILALVSALQKDERLPPDVQEDIATIYRNIELEARLIDDMLDLTRIVRGKLELRMETLDLRPSIEHAVKTCCAHDASVKNVTCENELADFPHTACVDPARLTQVFWNLLKNAIKFTPPRGTVTVRSRREKNADDTAWLVVEVSDTGMGIEPSELPRIFGAFEQGNRGITQRFGGLGLGLAISKAIVDRHGGTIEAASGGRGHGATFTLRLPAVESIAPAASPQTGEPSQTGDDADLVSAHLLLVEDHADTANIMARMLRRANFQVTVASSCKGALAAMAEAEKQIDANGRGRPIRLVISDLGLPDGTGHDLMSELRSRHNLRGIALSGFGMEEDVRRAHAAGFVKHLTKPVDSDGLIGAIRELLNPE